MKDFEKHSGNTVALEFCLITLLVGLLPALSGCAGSQEASSPTRPTAQTQGEETSEFDMPSQEFIAPGMTTGELKSLVGEPDQVEELEADSSEAWYYDFGMVIVKDGTVKYKYPPSRAAGKKPPS